MSFGSSPIIRKRLKREPQASQVTSDSIHGIASTMASSGSRSSRIEPYSLDNGASGNGFCTLDCLTRTRFDCADIGQIGFVCSFGLAFRPADDSISLLREILRIDTVAQSTAFLSFAAFAFFHADLRRVMSYCNPSFALSHAARHSSANSTPR